MRMFSKAGDTPTQYRSSRGPRVCARSLAPPRVACSQQPWCRHGWCSTQTRAGALCAIWYEYCQKTQEGAGQERGRERTPNAQASTDGPERSDTHKHPGQISRPDHKTPQAKRDIAHRTSARRDSHAPTVNPQCQDPCLPHDLLPGQARRRCGAPTWSARGKQRSQCSNAPQRVPRPESPMSSSRDRRSRACAIAAAKPTCCRMSDTIHARASVTERDPSVRQWRCAADDADWPMRVPTSREPPPAVLP